MDETINNVPNEIQEIERLAFSIYRCQDFMEFKFKPKEFLVDSMIHSRWLQGAYQPKRCCRNMENSPRLC